MPGPVAAVAKTASHVVQQRGVRGLVLAGERGGVGNRPGGSVLRRSRLIVVDLRTRKHLSVALGPRVLDFHGLVRPGADQDHRRLVAIVAKPKWRPRDVLPRPDVVPLVQDSVVDRAMWFGPGPGLLAVLGAGEAGGDAAALQDDPVVRRPAHMAGTVGTSVRVALVVRPARERGVAPVAPATARVRPIAAPASIVVPARAEITRPPSASVGPPTPRAGIIGARVGESPPENSTLHP